MSLLTALIVENSHILARIYFIFLRHVLDHTLKCYQYEIWTSVKRSGEYLLGKTNFSTFFAN